MKWLKKNKIVGITGLDTRSLTNYIRDNGAPKGTISNNKKGNFNIKKLLNNSIKVARFKWFGSRSRSNYKKNIQMEGIKNLEKGERI